MPSNRQLNTPDNAVLTGPAELHADATYAQAWHRLRSSARRVLRALCPPALRPVAWRVLLSVSAAVMPGRNKIGRVSARIYRAGGWGSRSTVSGPGSDLRQTARIVEEIPALLNDLGASSILDAPCGDLFWMKECNLGTVQYVGMDIVPELIEANQAQFGAAGRRFITGDLVTGDLPSVDVVLCRDCLVHLRTPDILRALHNIKRSGSTYILTTTFPSVTLNADIDHPGDWRRLNLERQPFGFPPPLRLINEGCTEGINGEFADKSLGLWKLSELPV